MVVKNGKHRLVGKCWSFDLCEKEKCYLTYATLVCWTYGVFSHLTITTICCINYYSLKIFLRFWLVKTARIIHHNHQLLTKILNQRRQKCSPLKIIEPTMSKSRQSAARCTLLSRWPRKPGYKVVLFWVSRKTKSEMSKPLQEWGNI